jgi:hypothetical protein
MTTEKKTFGKRRWWKAALIIVAVLVVIRLILPFVVLHYANKSLANLKGYYGHIRDIDIALIRGAYKIDSGYLNKVDSVTKKQTPFFAASLIDLSIEWKAIFHGSIVGEVVAENAVIRFSKEKVEPKTLKKDSSTLKKVGDNFMPLQLNRLEVKNGRIEYIDEFSKPKVDIALTNAYVLAKNLKNSYDSSTLLPASIEARADVYEGTLTFNMKLNPLADEPTFDMNTELKNTNLVKLNEFFQAYAKIDVNKGRFGLYAEAAGKNGKFTGYVKPLIRDLDVVGKEDRHDNVLQKLWENIAGTVGQIFKNQPKDQVATKIPFEGNIKDPNSNIWYTISELLQNAFIRAIQPSIDNQISIASVDSNKGKKKTFLQKVFGGKDKNKKKAKK